MLDDKPSVKTTVRRAFTHVSSESVPTTSRSVAIPAKNLPTTSSTLLTPGSTTMTNPVRTPAVSTAPTITKTSTSSVPKTTASEPYTSKAPIIPTVQSPDGNYNRLSEVETLLPVTLTEQISTTILETFPTPPSTISITSATQKIITTMYGAVESVTESGSIPSPENPPTVITSPHHPLLTSAESKEVIPTSDGSVATLKPFNLPELVTVPLYKAKDILPFVPPPKTTSNVEEKIILTSAQSPTIVPVEIEKTGESIIPPVNKPPFVVQSPVAVTRPGIISDVAPPPDVVVSSSSPNPVSLQSNTDSSFKVISSSTKLPTNEPIPSSDGNPSDRLTSAAPPFLFDIPVTKSVDVPMNHMQTPNRNWNPFIPSPGSTRSHSSLTIPLSIYPPINELTTTTKSIDTLPTTFLSNAGDKIIEIDSAVRSKASVYVSSSSIPPPIVASEKPFNTFLHSFSESLDSSVKESEDDFYKTTLPSSTSSLFKEASFPDSESPPVNLISENPWENPYSRKYVIATVPPEVTDKNKDVEWPVYKSHLSYSVKTDQLNEFKTLPMEAETVISSPIPFTFESSTLPPNYKLDTTYESSANVYAKKATTQLSKEFVSPPPAGGNNYFTVPQEDSLPNADEKFSVKGSSTSFPFESFGPKIVTADLLGKNGDTVEKVNIVNKNEFISFLRPNSVITTPGVIIPDGPTESKINELRTTDSINPRTYLKFNKTASYSDNVSVASVNKLQDSHSQDVAKVNFIANPVDGSSSRRVTRPSVTTPLTPSPEEMHSIVNGKSLEEPSNYLPTIYERLTTPSKGSEMERDENVKVTETASVTESAQSFYLPTNGDFLNLTYILNTINDFTSGTKKGMKLPSKSSVYGSPIKVKLTEKPASNDLVTNTVYSYDPSTETMKTISIRPSGKNRKQDHWGPRQLREKTSVNDSKIIHLNISSHLSFHNSASKTVPKISENSVNSKSSSSPLYSSSYSGSDPFGGTLDGRVTTVSIISTVPILKYPTKRSTEEYSIETENAFPPDDRFERVVDESDSSKERQPESVAYSRTTVPFSDSKRSSPSIPVSRSTDGEEVPKKPFRRKQSVDEDKLEDFRPNMTAALAAESTEEESYLNLTTGILATVTCVLFVGSVVAGFVLFFVYCKKEKPIPMESCIMAYGQPATTDATAIYSVPSKCDFLHYHHDFLITLRSKCFFLIS